jgi:hypothetical protein
LLHAAAGTSSVADTTTASPIGTRNRRISVASLLG